MCDRFPALDPFRVRTQSFHDVLAVYKRLYDQNKRKGKQECVQKNGVIRRPAQNDDWC
nr:MAG TPA: hypothetical protein [Caudoviricetes sp.]